MTTETPSKALEVEPLNNPSGPCIGKKVAHLDGKDTDSEPSTTESNTVSALPPSRRVQLRWTDVDYFVPTKNSNWLEDYLFPMGNPTTKAVYHENMGLPEPKIVKKDQGEFKQILTSCSGWVCPGEMVGILGPSGSGKTSLLSVLAQRQLLQGAEYNSGCVLTNSKSFEFGKIGAFVQQDDILTEELSAQELLTFACKIRLGLDESQVQQKVMSVIRRLNLAHCMT